MSFMTRIRIGRMQAVRARLTDAYAWHQAIWRAFPGRDGEGRDFLSRVDTKGDQIESLVLSRNPPEALHWGLWETREVPETFLGHERYYFSLRANPTVKRVVRSATGERKKNGRRTRIVDPEGLAGWLTAKAAPSGFAIEPASLRFEPPVDQKAFKKGTMVTHARVDYTGVLRVTERSSFKKAWHSGIGPARAFGFGMLLLKPLG